MADAVPSPASRPTTIVLSGVAHPPRHGQAEAERDQERAPFSVA
jgi:hypothetical protein